ncbi:hypothetical protein EMIHUDRAFT_107069 [Emiliania huxleyi CCMP1516]|uniref:Sucrose transporter n=2 Tax=Emiliania huxleyi TaxID=2903 RepID=A0A0D3I3T7_EMIH1|nr:hypothetical protein EMIHUDRAFT_107069 [Emiliania huxleyi CCMP1516]EOD05922.1 hypothetical protein EMIHUDRAFT_107069 [Emiliania huxleyi CCMP1516]|eukprot:XP_005758351.1 hypothetical protein EMIHUDRAFT_107069 [Emiliania huxleyi CCMP1516]
MAVGWLRRACLLLTGAAVEFGWAAGETVMIPHLVGGLNLSATIAGLVYVINPCIGLVAQPAVGHASDRCTSRFGRRRPFLLFLGLLAVVGLQVVAWSHELAGRLGWGRQSEVVTVFAAFTAMDCAHDLLLVPGRALAHDLLGGGGRTAESVDADFTAFQMAGRLLALLAGSAPLEALLSPRGATAPAGASAEPDGSYRHFVALLNLSTLFLASAVTAALVAGAADSHAPTGERHAAPLLPAAASEAASALPPSAVAPAAGTEEEEAAGTAARRLPRHSRAQLALLLACQFLGWTLIQCQAFWWTEWVGVSTPLHVPLLLPAGGLRLAFCSLALQALVAICTSLALPLLGRRFGTATACRGAGSCAWRAVWAAGELLLVASCVGTRGAPSPGARPGLVFLLAALSGLSLAPHSASIFSLCEAVIGSAIASHKASVIALANNTLPLAQLLTGLFAGAFVQRFLPHRPGGSSSRGGGEEAVGSLFLYGGAAIGGSEALLLLLLRLYGGGFWRGEQPSEVAGRERGGGAGSTARTTESPDAQLE